MFLFEVVREKLVLQECWIRFSDGEMRRSFLSNWVIVRMGLALYAYVRWITKRVRKNDNQAWFLGNARINRAFKRDIQPWFRGNGHINRLDKSNLQQKEVCCWSLEVCRLLLRPVCNDRLVKIKLIPSVRIHDNVKHIEFLFSDFLFWVSLGPAPFFGLVIWVRLEAAHEFPRFGLSWYVVRIEILLIVITSW